MCIYTIKCENKEDCNKIKNKLDKDSSISAISQIDKYGYISIITDSKEKKIRDLIKELNIASSYSLT